MNRKIVSITLNPSIDVTLWTDRLSIDDVNRVVRENREAGGKGINVSHVAKAFGAETICIGLLGRDNSREFLGLLQDEGLACRHIEIDGAVRENLTVRYKDYTLKINRKGPAAPEDVLDRLYSLIESCINPGDIAVFAGSIPENIPVEGYMDLILRIKGLGALIAIDSDIFSFEQYGRLSPWLIKPNIHELRNILKLSGEAVNDIKDAAGRLCENGVENVLVSLGGNGLVYCSKEVSIRVSVPKVDVKSTVGAGDSVLAGFAAAYVKGGDNMECVRLAAACGTASVLRDGTGLAEPVVVHEIMEQVKAVEF
ncbi:MAG TPA: 1-phosphofructokinase family hexose kinase [Candidatus Avimonas sp.]|nr:1-phosphofructokinase family hexose kinase [Candidatus Avimonas sp.]